MMYMIYFHNQKYILLLFLNIYHCLKYLEVENRYNKVISEKCLAKQNKSILPYQRSNLYDLPLNPFLTTVYFGIELYKDRNS